MLKQENVLTWEKMSALEPNFIEMEWQTNDNVVDCGIFVMRHMETYMGGRRIPWAGTLQNEKVGKNQMEKLRKIYCHQMLTSPLNEKREEIMKAVGKSLNAMRTR
ncbi:hypothetical protein ACET3Z_025873 [Daucus carota]